MKHRGESDSIHCHAGILYIYTAIRVCWCHWGVHLISRGVCAVSLRKLKAINFGVVRIKAPFILESKVLQQNIMLYQD